MEKARYKVLIIIIIIKISKIIWWRGGGGRGGEREKPAFSLAPSPIVSRVDLASAFAWLYLLLNLRTRKEKTQEKKESYTQA